MYPDLTFILLLTLLLCCFGEKETVSVYQQIFKVVQMCSSILNRHGSILPHSCVEWCIRKGSTQQVSVLHCWTHHCFNHINIDCLHWHFSCLAAATYRSHSALTNIQKFLKKALRFQARGKGQTITQSLTPLSLFTWIVIIHTEHTGVISIADTGLGQDGNSPGFYKKLCYVTHHFPLKLHSENQ